MRTSILRFCACLLGAMLSTSGIVMAQAAAPDPQPDPAADPVILHDAQQVWVLDNHGHLGDLAGLKDHLGHLHGAVLAQLTDAQKAEIDAAVVAAQGAADHLTMFAAAAEPKKEKAAFLGVVASAADPALRSQLKLQRGIGLVVQSVTDDSPAAAAGIQEHDILMKLDDQWLVNSSQLGVIVRMHKAGDEVNVTLVREGQQQVVKAKLAEKEMVVPESSENFNAMGQWQGLPVPPVPPMPQLDRFMLDADDANVIIQDGGQTLKISVKNDERHLVATDDNGQVLFDGPIETDEQRKAVPAEIAEKLEKYKEQVDSAKDNAGGQRKVRIFRGGR
jgi:hypothetical protein